MKVHKMSFNECLDLEIDDYVDYLEFDLIRSPENNNDSSLVEEFES